MSELKGTLTHKNLKKAFAWEARATQRWQWMALKADREGLREVGALFRDTADSDAGHAGGHLEMLTAAGDPVTNKPIGDTAANLEVAVADCTRQYTELYPEWADAARAEGLDEIAEWFETLARAERSHAGRFQRALDALG